MSAAQFHAPIRPYSPIDALNRRAAALGSPGYAQATKGASYNGHHVSVTWNDYRGYYIAEHFWAGRVVHARGTFSECLAAALREYDRGELGASVSACPRADDAVAIEECSVHPRLISGPIDFACADWSTWQHRAAAESARDYANPQMAVRIFDWPLMQTAADLIAYEAAVKAKHGRIWT